VWDYGHSLRIGAPGPYEFAAALWTLSLNHWLPQRKRLLAL